MSDSAKGCDFSQKLQALSFSHAFLKPLGEGISQLGEVN